MLRAPLVLLLLLLNLAFWATLVFLGGILRLAAWGRARRSVILGIAWLAERWGACNDAILDLMLDTRWDIEGNDALLRHGNYLVISNHISWVDIFAVVRAFRGRTPFLRFFLKRGLFWAPFAGQAAWALDFPFMRRYTAEYLALHPEKRGLDLETTMRACRRFRQVPVTILNFVEGTRFTREKHEEQGSPYRHLLRPRIGGIAFVVAAMADQLEGVIDVTIAYPGHDITLMEFAANRVPRVTLRARTLAIPHELRDPAITEPGPARDRFRLWVEEIWREKDALLDELS